MELRAVLLVAFSARGGEPAARDDSRDRYDYIVNRSGKAVNRREYVDDHSDKYKHFFGFVGHFFTPSFFSFKGVCFRPLILLSYEKRRSFREFEKKSEK